MKPSRKHDGEPVFPLAVSWRLLAFLLLRIQRNLTSFYACFRQSQLKETTVSAIVIPSLHLRKHMKTLRKHVFFMFPLTYSGLRDVWWWNLRKHKKPCGNWCLYHVSATGFRLINVLFHNYLPLSEIIIALLTKTFYFLLLPETRPYWAHGR